MIDWTRISELIDEFGPDDFAEVVDLFLAEVEGAIAQLDDLDKSPENWAEQMHFLKGAVLNLGFSAMSDLCRKGEEAARGGDITVVSAHDIRTVFDASRKQFELDLPARLAA